MACLAAKSLQSGSVGINQHKSDKNPTKEELRKTKRTKVDDAQQISKLMRFVWIHSKKAFQTKNKKRNLSELRVLLQKVEKNWLKNCKL